MRQKEQPKSGSLFENRTVLVDGEPCLLRVEPSYWAALDEICLREGLSIEELCTDLLRRIDGERVSLANAIRVFSVGYFRQAATETGHHRAGHGQGDPFVATPFDSDLDAPPH
jgi:predicted DNA-binding ribbon-helix-helix protein